MSEQTRRQDPRRGPMGGHGPMGGMRMAGEKAKDFKGSFKKLLHFLPCSRIFTFHFGSDMYFFDFHIFQHFCKDI